MVRFSSIDSVSSWRSRIFSGSAGGFLKNWGTTLANLGWTRNWIRNSLLITNCVHWSVVIFCQAWQKWYSLPLVDMSGFGKLYLIEPDHSKESGQAWQKRAPLFLILVLLPFRFSKPVGMRTLLWSLSGSSRFGNNLTQSTLWRVNN